MPTELLLYPQDRTFKMTMSAYPSISSALHPGTDVLETCEKRRMLTHNGHRQKRTLLVLQYARPMFFYSAYNRPYETGHPVKEKVEQTIGQMITVKQRSHWSVRGVSRDARIGYPQ